MAKEKKGKTLFRVELLETTFGNDKGDILLIKEEDKKYYYYYDGFDRWCYIEKESCRKPNAIGKGEKNNEKISNR